MKKSHKQIFINQHGQAKWDLMNAYKKGNRSAEATEAERLYAQIKMGLTQDTYTIYSISENGKIIYIGKTGINPKERWTAHRTTARTFNKAAPLHYHMNTVSTDHKLFPEFLFQIITTTTDKQSAEDLEIAYIKAYNTHIDGFNKRLGGGNKSKKLFTRPSQPQNVTTRPESI
jgi:hypothetical protein